MAIIGMNFKKGKNMQNVDEMYKVLVEGFTPHEVRPDLYEEDDEDLEIIEPSYVNRTTTENGERCIYWEENYDPSAYRLGENDSEKAKAIIDKLEEYGIEF